MASASVSLEPRTSSKPAPFQTSGLPAGPDTERQGPASGETESGVVTTGLLLYGSSTVFNSGQSLFAKLVGQRGFPVFETVLTRSLFIFACACVPLAVKRVDPRGKQRGFLVLRGVFSFASVSALFWSVMLLPLADALVLQFLSPPMIAVLAPLLLKEVPSRSVLIAVPICLLAVVLIAQPSALFGASSSTARSVTPLGVCVGIFQALAASLNKIVARHLKAENASVSLLYLSAIGILGSSVACISLPSSLVAPSSAPLTGLLTANAVCAYLTQLTITLGLQRVGATLGTALSYLTVVWGMILGRLVFHEVPSALSLLGAAMICAAAGLLSLTEHFEAHGWPSWEWVLSRLQAGWQAVKRRLQSRQYEPLEEGQVSG